MPDEELKPIVAPIIVERNYLVDGKKVTVQIKFPAALGKEIGMERSYAAAAAMLVTMDAKKAVIKPLKRGE